MSSHADQPNDWPLESGSFALGDFVAEKGGTIHSAQIGWERHGTLNAARDNLVLYPSGYGMQHTGMARLVRPDGILDPTRWCIVAVDMFSNGVSSGAADTLSYPRLVTMADNVRAQHRLVRERFGVDTLAAVYGFAMGGMQAYHWAALYPTMVQRVIVVRSGACMAPHNQAFLSELLQVLETAPEHLGNGRFSAEPVAAKRWFGFSYTGWGLIQDFDWAGLLRPAPDAYDFETSMQPYLEMFEAHRAANLHAQALAWYYGNIADNALYGGDLPRALKAITARVLLLPRQSDLYFRVTDNEAEQQHLATSELRATPTISGKPGTDPAQTAFLRAAVRDWMER